MEAFALHNMCYESTHDRSDFSDDSFDRKMENDFTITNHADIHEACEQRKEISEKQCWAHTHDCKLRLIILKASVLWRPRWPDWVFRLRLRRDKKLWFCHKKSHSQDAVLSQEGVYQITFSKFPDFSRFSLTILSIFPDCSHVAKESIQNHHASDISCDRHQNWLLNCASMQDWHYWHKKSKSASYAFSQMSWIKQTPAIISHK